MSLSLTDLLRPLANPQILTLVLVLAVGSGLVLHFSSAMAPFITAFVVAYLLERGVKLLQGWRVPRLMAVTVVFGLFLLLLNLFLFGVLPILMQQLTRLLGDLPRMIETFRTITAKLSDAVAGLIPAEFSEKLLLGIVTSFQDMVASSVSTLLQQLPGLVSLLLYLFLVPFLVFFFLKDKDELLDSIRQLIPRDRHLLRQVFNEVNIGVGGYVYGKFWELSLLGAITYLVFTIMAVPYASLLALLTGLSVLIPFLGVAVVAIPVLAIGLFQGGMEWEALHPLMAYGILQLVDANILTPLILGETVHVHPVSIMLAVFIFGSLWGIPGVFFAVPLAVLVKSVVKAIHDNS
ncbi:MAG: AI-2E family transporter [Magnetococcales bacterium]|nr:AI-2E family transporter [Magnetococcales bacterium]